MRIITTREFRANQRVYFEMSEHEKIIITRGKDKKPVLLTPIDEGEESDMYFSDPRILKSIQEGIEDVKAGRTTKIRDPKNIWQDIL